MKIFLITLFILYINATELVLPKTFANQDIDGWVMSEKLDGVRGHWDGKALWSKQHNRLYPPKEFIQNFPPFELDGELWIGRGKFEETSSLVMSQSNSTWSPITYNIFEVPNTDGDLQKRLAKAKDWFNTHPNKKVKIIEQIEAQSREHLMSYLKKIETLGGEGVIVRDPTAPYTTGRSGSILKVKSYDDMEGRVIDVNLHENSKRLRSLVLLLPDGNRLNLGNGFSQTQRTDYPQIGDLVTFKYYGFTKNGIPKFASFLRVRESAKELRAKIASLFIIGFRGFEVPNIIEADIKKGLGGVILFDHNIQNPEQLKTLTTKLKSLNPNLYIAVDQEGGKVERLDEQNGFYHTPSAKEISQMQLNEAKKYYIRLSKTLHENGINLNFAPCVDLDIQPRNPIISKTARSYGANSTKVSQYSTLFVDSLHENKILSSLKHFPGHGSSINDSHEGFTDITQTWQNVELEPYKSLIQANKAPMIMVGHLYNKNIDDTHPASLSYNTIQTLLRKKLQYDGIVITDDMMM